nr:hypothetical protein BaRGS_033083 [Batillaria attramentaria]
MLAPVAGRNVEFVENAGLRLTNLAPEDAGVYSVHVNVNRHGSIPTESQNVTLLVSVHVDGLEVRLLLLEAGQQALREDNLMLTQKVLNLTGEVIQRRVDGSVDFYRGWQEYEDGFGDVHGEYWLEHSCILRVDLEAFDGDTAYAVYSHFNISGPEDNYRLHVSDYNGTAGK